MSSEGFKALKVPINHSSTSVSSSETVTEISKPSHKPEDISSPHELTAFVESVLGQLETRFDEMSSQIMERSELIAYCNAMYLSKCLPCFSGPDVCTRGCSRNVNSRPYQW